MFLVFSLICLVTLVLGSNVGHGQRFTTSIAPCALQNYLYESDDRNSARLSHTECQLAFMHWFAYDRRASTIFDNRTFVCPLLPCLKHFDILEPFLQHLLDGPSSRMHVTGVFPVAVLKVSSQGNRPDLSAPCLSSNISVEDDT